MDYDEMDLNEAVYWLAFLYYRCKLDEEVGFPPNLEYLHYRNELIASVLPATLAIEPGPDRVAFAREQLDVIIGQLRKSQVGPWDESWV